MNSLYSIGRPILGRLPPEIAHNITIRALKLGFVPGNNSHDPALLGVEAMGLRFSNPIGLAAGFDKNAEVVDAMLQLGFGFVEAGTVTPNPQRGNPKPRVFRLPDDGAVINRLGFNNDGLDVFARHMAGRARGPAGANIGANSDSPDRIADYETGLRRLYAHADFFTVNVSSPNTPGLRGLQEKEALGRLLSRLQAVAVEEEQAQGVRRPILLKIAPDLDDAMLENIIEVASAHGLDGLVVSNTTISRPPTLHSQRASESGGLSGRPLYSLSTAVLRKAFRLCGGKLTLIGVGGIFSGADAYGKIRAGATLVELYTALTAKGPGLIENIKGELTALLAADGFSNVAAAVGADALDD